MNALSFKKIHGTESFPWFDEYIEANRFCKVYNDGGCYIAVPASKVPKKRKYCRIKMPIDDRFDQLYLEAIKSNLSKMALKEYIFERLREEYPNELGLIEYVDKKILGLQRNLGARKKRFRRKAFLNPWNYFVTITYDDEFQNEESFKKGLRKCLSNLHTRRGWLYMGVFERAPDTGRLHFHAIMNIPDDAMIGEIYERRDYSKKHHNIQITHPNTFFEKRFGRNDFEPLSDVELKRGNTMQYLLKYLKKTGERVVYSRGIPTEFYADINENDIICEMVDFVVKYILFNDVIDYDEDVRQNRSSLIYQKKVPLPS